MGGGELTSLVGLIGRDRGRFGGYDDPPHDDRPRERAYNGPGTAPLKRPVEVRVKDRFGEGPLPFPCARTQAGWIVVRSGKPLDASLTVTGWRYRDFRK